MFSLPSNAKSPCTPCNRSHHTHACRNQRTHADHLVVAGREPQSEYHHTHAHNTRWTVEHQQPVFVHTACLARWATQTQVLFVMCRTCEMYIVYCVCCYVCMCVPVWAYRAHVCSIFTYTSTTLNVHNPYFYTHWACTHIRNQAPIHTAHMFAQRILALVERW